MIRWKGFYKTPIYLDSNGWYFYDETWAYPEGPYPNHIECAATLLEYCDYLNEEVRNEIQNKRNLLLS